MLRPQPYIHGFEDVPFWEYCKKGELRLQRCRQSGRFLWPILPVDPDTLSDELDWVQVSGKGVISSWIVYRRVYYPEFENRVPYIVANIELPEGARMTGNVFGPDGEWNADKILGPSPRLDALNGRAVTLFFEDCGHDLAIPQWKLTGGNP